MSPNRAMGYLTRDATSVRAAARRAVSVMGTRETAVPLSDGRHQGMRQFLDDKAFKPGLGEYDKRKA